MRNSITIAKISAWNQKNGQDDAEAKRVVLPGATSKRPEEHVFYSNQNRFHEISALFLKNLAYRYFTIEPSRISTSREAIAAASGLCVIITMVCLNSRLSFCSISRTIVEFS